MKILFHLIIFISCLSSCSELGDSESGVTTSAPEKPIVIPVSKREFDPYKWPDVRECRVKDVPMVNIGHANKGSSYRNVQTFLNSCSKGVSFQLFTELEFNTAVSVRMQGCEEKPFWSIPTKDLAIESLDKDIALFKMKTEEIIDELFEKCAIENINRSDIKLLDGFEEEYLTIIETHEYFRDLYAQTH